ncbi:hypothetical protein ANCCEY_07960, partial [Ancylostoma ceylanicum]
MTTSMTRNLVHLRAVTTYASTQLRWFWLPRRWKVSYVILIWLCLMFIYILYEVQYKTGIEILPFVPIDDSGFEEYNETLLREVKASEAAMAQRKVGSILCWVMTTSVYHKTR